MAVENAGTVKGAAITADTASCQVHTAPHTSIVCMTTNPKSCSQVLAICKPYACCFADCRCSAGRFDAFQAWFLRWEGLLFGGLVMSGLVAGAARIYQRERLDDIHRSEGVTSTHKQHTIFQSSRDSSMQPIPVLKVRSGGQQTTNIQ